MEKEIDPMLEKFYEGVELEQEDENLGDEKTAEELEAEKAEQERLAEEQRVKDEEEVGKDRSGEDDEVKAKAEQEKLAKEEADKNRSDFSDSKVEEVDNGEWLKDFEAALLKKNEYKSLSAEQKALAYLKEQNPYLDEDDLIFKAAQEYGIGAEALDEEDLKLLTDKEKAELKAQEIKRKGLLHEADGYLKAQSDAIELPKIPNPIEADEEYKSYKEQIKLQAEQDAKFAEEQKEVFAVIDNTATKLEKIEIEPKITLDEREFSFRSEFKLDENKRKELAQFAKDYTPTQSELDTYYPQDGKFNAEGYLSHLAERLFHKQIINAAVKEGIAQAREEFVEKDLKNSTLRNNSTMQQSNREVDPEIAAMRA